MMQLLLRKGGRHVVSQAPMLDGLSLDPFALVEDGWCPAEVGVGGRYVVQASWLRL